MGLTHYSVILFLFIEIVLCNQDNIVDQVLFHTRHDLDTPSYDAATTLEDKAIPASYFFIWGLPLV